MSSPNEPRMAGETVPESENPFGKGNETARMVLGTVQLFVFVIALLLLLVVAVPQ